MKKSFLLLVTVAFTYCTVNAQKITLNVNKGQKYSINTTTKMNNSAEVMGQTMETNVSSTTVGTAEITDVKEKAFDVTEVVSKMQSSMSMMGQEMNYDSDKKDNNEKVADIYEKMLNKPKSYTIGLDGFIIKENTPIIKEKEGEDEMNPMAMFGGSGVAASGVSIYLPSVLNKDLAVGFTWMDSTTTKGKMSTKAVNNYKVISIENGIVTVENNSIVSINGVIEQMGQEMGMSSTSTIKALSKINQKTGILQETVSEGTSKSTIEAAGMSIPANGTISTKIEVTAN
jgi:hypothetical protein